MEIVIPEILLGAFAFFAIGYLGLAVYLRNPKSWTNRFFILLSFVLVSYVVFNYFSIHPPKEESHLLWIRIVMSVGSFMGPALFLLIHTFPSNAFRLRIRYLIPILVLMLTSAIFSLTPLVFKSLENVEGQPIAIPGWGMLVFALNFVGLFFLSFVVLVRKFVKAKGQERVKTLYLLIGVLSSFSLMTIATIVSIVIFKTSAAIFLGPIFPVILTGFLAYAIVRHRFLDIQPLIARAVSFLLLIIIFASVYSFVVLFVFRRFFDIPPSVFAIFMTLTVLAIFSFQPIERVIRKISNRIFFKGQYNREKLISDLTHIMASTIDLRYMMNTILVALKNGMHISKGAFLIIDNHKIVSMKGIGYKNHEFESKELEKLFHKRSTSDHHFLFEDLEEGSLKDLFRKLDISIAIPIRVEKEEVAVLILGPKLSGEIYYQRDIDLLDIFSSQAGVAIQNAKAYAVIKKFSQVLEQRVRERTKELERLYDIQSEFMADISHQLQSPLAIMKGNMGLIRRRFRDKDHDEALNSIEEALDRISRFINDLLTLAKADFGQQKFKKELIELNNLIRDIYEQFKTSIEDKGIGFKFQEREKLTILGDRERLRDLFLNLVINATKYTPKGGKIEVKLYKENNWAKIEIVDTGEGISKKDLPHIFERFYQAERKVGAGGDGIGLGLAISAWIAKAHKGTITVQSKLGKGSTFTVSLPIHRD